MFGALVVQNTKNELGFLFTFSGKLKDNEHAEEFVPSLFDLNKDDFFLSEGMIGLSAIGAKIKAFKAENEDQNKLEIQ